MVQERDDIVALDSAILQHPQVWEASRPPRGLHRPAGRLPRRASSASAPTTSTGARSARAEAVQAARRGRRLRPHRGARVQPDVRDVRRAGEGRRRDRLPAPRDGAGHLHQLQERPAVRAQEAAVRDRADRQVVPQRDHARQLHLPHARVRADGDGVLRPAGRGAASGTSTGWRSGCAGTRELGIRPDHLRLRAHDADELSHYSSRHERHRVPLPDRLVGARGHRQPRRLRPHPARRVLGREARVLRPGDGRALRPARDRAGRRRRPRDARVPRRRLRRGGGRGRAAHRAAPAPAARAGQGRGAAAGAARTASPRSRARSTSDLRAPMPAEYDEGGSIGKRYRRQDEIGTPWGVTVDHQTLEDAPSRCATATRWSRSASPIDELADELERRLAAPLALAEARCGAARPLRACARPLA